VYCGRSWGFDLYLNYTLDFLGCIDGCAIWNESPENWQCVGVDFAPGNYGPDGKHSQCYYKWQTGQDYTSFYLVDGAKLESGIQTTTTVESYKEHSP